jgi:hypothetical protein
MREEDIQLGGGNVWAILTSGILMFLFYALGWGYMGTFALFVFIIVGIKSLFPIIAAFWGLLILCIYHFPEPVAIIAIIFWIVAMTTMEIVARSGVLDKEEGENKSASDKNGHS